MIDLHRSQYIMMWYHTHWPVSTASPSWSDANEAIDLCISDHSMHDPERRTESILSDRPLCSLLLLTYSYLFAHIT